MRELRPNPGLRPSEKQTLGTGAFGLIILSIGLSLNWMWQHMIRPNLAVHALIEHQPFIDWPSMVGYMLTAVGGAGSGFFFLDYYRAHDAPKGRHIFTATALLVSLMVSLSLVNWVIFGLYGQVAAYTETYSILYPAVVAGDLLAPWLFGVLLAFWGGSLIRFSHDLERKSPAFRVVKIAGSLFLIAAVLTILIPALNIAVAVSLMGDDVFNLYGVWLLNEVVFSPLNLALVWAGSILTTVSWRSSTTLAT